MKVSRKIKKQIPKGMYCYTGIRYDFLTGIYHIKSCPQFKYIKTSQKHRDLQNEIDLEFSDAKIGWCKLIKSEIDDQCKSCGIKTGF